MKSMFIGALSVMLGVGAVAHAQGAADQERRQQGQQQPSQNGQQESRVGKPPGQQSSQAAQPPSQQGGAAKLESIKLSSLDENQAKQLQQKLHDLGYYQGAVDGVIGPGTNAALSRYFTEQAQLVRQGRISEQGMTVFGFDKDEVQRVKGIEKQQGEQPMPTRGPDQPAPSSPGKPDMRPTPPNDVPSTPQPPPDTQ
jgi:hypothetical protein